MNENYKFFISSHVGNVRKNNEDFYGEKRLSGGHVFVVCDGMGGHSGGEIASQKAVECILDYCTRSSGENAVQMIHEAIKFANSQVHGFATTYPEYKGMGTTCVVVYLTNQGKLYYGHVGDSRLYIHNKQGLRSITKDHSYVQYLVDIGEIKESEMESHPSKNQILRALGIDEVVKPEVCQEPLYPSPGDTFLLCSDGLNGMIGSEDIRQILDSKRQGKTMDSISAHLIQAALDAGGKDNVTVGLIDFGGGDEDKTMILGSSKRKTNSKKFRQYAIGALIVLGLCISGYLMLRREKVKEGVKAAKSAETEQELVKKPQNAGDSTKQDTIKIQQNSTSGKTPDPENNSSEKDSADDDSEKTKEIKNNWPNNESKDL